MKKVTKDKYSEIEKIEEYCENEDFYSKISESIIEAEEDMGEEMNTSTGGKDQQKNKNSKYFNKPEELMGPEEDPEEVEPDEYPDEDEDYPERQYNPEEDPEEDDSDEYPEEEEYYPERHYNPEESEPEEYEDEDDEEDDDEELAVPVKENTASPKAIVKLEPRQTDNNVTDEDDYCLVDEKIKSLPKALQKECQWVKNFLDNMVQNNLRQLWSLGQRLNKLAEDKSGKYGSDPIGKMSEILDGKFDRGRLAKIWHFYRDFPESLLNWALSQRMKRSGRGITWSHIIWITTLPSLDDRKYFLQQTFNNDWSPDELAKAVRQHTQRPTRAGGRPVVVPATLSAQLDNLIKIVSMYLRNDKVIWRNQEKGLEVKFNDFLCGFNGDDKSLKNIHEKLEKAFELAKNVAVTAEEHLILLKSMLNRVETMKNSILDEDETQDYDDE